MFYYTVGKCFHSLAGGNRGGDAVLIRISELLHLLPNPRRHLFRDREAPTFFFAAALALDAAGEVDRRRPRDLSRPFLRKKEEEVK